MLLSIVIVSWNTRDLLDACLASVAAEINKDFGGLNGGSNNSLCQVFVVDNASADGSAAMVAEKYPWVKLIANSDNKGFAAGNNQAFQLSNSEYVLMLNPDTEVKAGALKLLIEFFADHQKAAVVAPQLLNTDGSIQRSCRQFPTFIGMLYELIGLSRLFPASSPRGIKFRKYKMLDWNHDDERQVDQPEGACLMIKGQVLKEVGTLDEGFFMLFEEVDWCYRVKKAGYQIWFTPRAQVIHHYGQSIKQVKVAMILSSHRGLYRFWRKHYRGGRWWLDAFAYLGLMALAYVRIAGYKLKALVGQS